MFDSVLVFYWFESDRVRIEQKYKNRIPVLDSKDRNVQDMITKWNNGEIPVMLAHPASVGHGLNLQEGRAYTKVIKMVKSPKTGAYIFDEQMVPNASRARTITCGKSDWKSSKKRGIC